MRAYFLTLQYWLAGSEAEHRQYGPPAGGSLRRRSAPRTARRRQGAATGRYADIGVYHPRIKDRIAETRRQAAGDREAKGTVGLLLLRSYCWPGIPATMTA